MFIDRKPIVANVVAIAALVDRPLALMAIAAERAQRPKAEGVVIAFVGRMVISDGGRRDAASFLAQGAQRGSRKLVFGPSSPGLQGVPIAPMERLRQVLDCVRSLLLMRLGPNRRTYFAQRYRRRRVAALVRCGQAAEVDGLSAGTASRKVSSRIGDPQETLVGLGSQAAAYGLRRERQPEQPHHVGALPWLSGLR